MQHRRAMYPNLYQLISQNKLDTLQLEQMFEVAATHFYTAIRRLPPDQQRR